MSGSSQSFAGGDMQQQQGAMNPMEANAAERLKIMAQQHQQHQATPPVSCGSMGPSGMGPSRMGGGPQMQGQQPNMYHGNMQQQPSNVPQQQQMGPGPNAMSNGHMMANLPPGGMPMPQQQPMHPGMRQGGGPPGSLPNLPTMPLPQSMPSSPMMTPTSSPAMSNMQQCGPMPPHVMSNGPMGHNPGMGPGPGMHQNMYNNSMMDPATAMVRMRAQGRYRLGTPNPNAMPGNMRPGMPMGAGGGPPVMPGQSSPMGGGMPPLPQVMSNQNMRQQVSFIKIF
jgi:hypothetical protein